MRQRWDSNDRQIIVRRVEPEPISQRWSRIRCARRARRRSLSPAPTTELRKFNHLRGKTGPHKTGDAVVLELICDKRKFALGSERSRVGSQPPNIGGTNKNQDRSDRASVGGGQSAGSRQAQ